MIGVYAGKLTNINIERRSFMGVADTAVVKMEFESQDICDYDKLTIRDDEYSLVRNKDIMTTNDELLKLRDEAKRLTDEISKKDTAYGKLDEAYGILAADRDCWKSKTEKLEAELTEIKTARTLREAYITGVEKGCEGLKEELDRWKLRCNSVMTDLSNALSAHGIELTINGVLGDVNWKFEFDIPELNEAKKEITELKRKLKAVESKEEYWRDRKEEEEDYHHFWLHTYNLAVGSAADKGVRIFMTGEDAEYNVGVISVKNEKAEELESQVVELEKKIKRLEDDNHAKAEAVVAAKDRGDYWLREHDVKSRMYQELEQKHDAKWTSMCDALKAKGVEVIYMGEEDGKPIVDVKIPNLTQAKETVGIINASYLKAKSEIDELKAQCDILRKNYVVRGQTISDLNAEIDKLKKELEALKSRTLDKVEIRLSYGDIVWTYCDGFVHISSKIDGIISADQITTGSINCLCKDHVAVDAESLSHGTVPKCSSCAHYMHNAKYAHDWCYKAVHKEGPKFIRKLSKEEAEGPCCVDYKEREPECKSCRYYRDGSWRSSEHGEELASCCNPNTKYGFCANNCAGKKACDFFEREE